MLCPECKIEKDVSRFIWKPSGKLARKPCRDCLNIKQREKYLDPEWRAKHRARCDDWESRNHDVRRDISRRWRDKNPDAAKAATKAWIERNLDRWRKYMQEWSAANRERAKELRKLSPPDSGYRQGVKRRNKMRYIALTAAQREQERQRQREYARNNRAPFNARRARRRALELQATPQWGQNGIKELYKLAAEHGFHVDHIVPLNSPIVCGLHVIFNLQLLPPTENFSKSNKFDPDAHVHSIGEIA